jgi:hypothetical protein
MNVVKSIIEPQEFIWDKKYEDDYSVFEYNSLKYHYDPYSYKLLQPTKNGLMLIKTSPRLEVFTMSDVLFIGELTIHYHVLENDFGFADILRNVLKSSHLEFIQAFDKREASTSLNKFRPEFSDEIVEKHIYLLLHAFD